MKDILLIFSIVAVCTTFIINQSLKRDQSYKLTSTGTCSDQRVKIVNQSVNLCQSSDYTQAAVCIKNILQSRVPNQKWNVISQSNTSDAQSSYWYYNDCSLIYEMNKTLRVKLTIWKASASPVQQELLNQQNQQKDKDLSSFKNENCTSERFNAIFYAVGYCQNNNSSLQAICIRNNFMTRLGQKWDSLVWTDDGISYRYDYYNGCSLQLYQYGRNSRNYLVWKAQ